MKRIICFFLGHIRINRHHKDIFNHEYIWLKETCKCCGKELN